MTLRTLAASKAPKVNKSLTGAADSDPPGLQAIGKRPPISDALGLDLDEPGRFQLQQRLPVTAGGAGIMNGGTTLVLRNQQMRTGPATMLDLQQLFGASEAYWLPPHDVRFLIPQLPQTAFHLS